MLVCLCNIFGSDTVERSQPRTEEWVMLKHAHKTAITLVYREEWKGHRKLFSPRYDVKGRWIQVQKQVMQKDIAGMAVDVQIKGTFRFRFIVQMKERLTCLKAKWLFPHKDLWLVLNDYTHNYIITYLFKHMCANQMFFSIIRRLPIFQNVFPGEIKNSFLKIQACVSRSPLPDDPPPISSHITASPWYQLSMCECRCSRV